MNFQNCPNFFTWWAYPGQFSKLSFRHCIHYPTTRYQFSRILKMLIDKQICFLPLLETFLIHTYTVLHIFRQVLFGAGNQGNHQYFEKYLLTNKLWHVFMGMKQKKIFFWWKKNSKWPTQKNWVFQLPPKAEQLSPKFYRLVLGLVGLIDAKGINVTQPIWPSGCPT